MFLVKSQKCRESIDVFFERHPFCQKFLIGPEIVDFPFEVIPAFLVASVCSRISLKDIWGLDLKMIGVNRER